VSVVEFPLQITVGEALAVTVGVVFTVTETVLELVQPVVFVPTTV
jgi:hypothetical protein